MCFTYSPIPSARGICVLPAEESGSRQKNLDLGICCANTTSKHSMTTSTVTGSFGLGLVGGQVMSAGAGELAVGKMGEKMGGMGVFLGDRGRSQK